jgi:hypothetical protein
VIAAVPVPTAAITTLVVFNLPAVITSAASIALLNLITI